MNAQPWLLLLIACSSAAHAASLVPRAHSRLNQLRGGQAEEESPPKALTREEIFEKLSHIPVFAIETATGDLVGTEVNGEKSICWFTDASEATAKLESSKGGKNLAANILSDVPSMKLSVHTLGAAFVACKGFGNDESAQAHRAKLWGAIATADMRLTLSGNAQVQASTPVLAERLMAMLKDQGIDANGWTLPIFISDALQSPGLTPVFFTLDDLKAFWLRHGGEEGELPADGIKVLDLRMLVASMQTDSAAWSTVAFMAPPAAIELAKELSQQA